jgi:ankyrin repeat protein
MDPQQLLLGEFTMNTPGLTADDVLKRYAKDELPEFIGVQLDSIEAVGSSGSRPLHVACSRGDLEEVRALVSAGAELNAIGDLGNTPLHDAVGANSPSIVEYLLSSGADQSIRNEYMQTAKDLAVLMERRALMDVFLRWQQLK